jgi:hypothetical protein
VRAIDTKNLPRSASLGEELTRREEGISSNDPRTVALVAESLRLGGASGASASLSYLSKKSSLLLSSSSSCHPWILFVRAMDEPPGDFSCLPEEARAGFARSLDAARTRGFTLTEWSRAVTTGRP